MTACPACRVDSMEPRLMDGVESGDLYCMNSDCRVWVFMPSVGKQETTQ